MLRAVNGKVFNIDTPRGKAEYTLAALKYRKALKECKRQKLINDTVIRQVINCSNRVRR